MPRILILGAGFAGLWAAVGAARRLSESAQSGKKIEILVVNNRPFHSVRVRNYEQDLDPTRVPLAEVLDPIGVKWMEGVVLGIDTRLRKVPVQTRGGTELIDYTRLVVALGSKLVHPDIPGLAEHSFDVDTIEGAEKLQRHLLALPSSKHDRGRYVAVVIGAGLTGVEIASELPARLAGIAGSAQNVRVLLVDRSVKIAQAMGQAQPVIEQAMGALKVELKPGTSIKNLTDTAVELSDGEIIETPTVVWCGGMRANSLTEQFPVARDELGRLPVDACLRVQGLPDIFATGDCARILIDGTRPSVMSCQHGRPMGRYAGHNVVADLLGQALLPLHVDWYTTIVDLGPWGAVYTEGWDRKLITQGAQAKRTKRLINGQRIYPPRTGRREDILQAGAPIVQAPPPDNLPGC
ncbi:MAG: NAD(P)/FAD-dependent oxidoreductase [Candidimonas sp.]|nr:MAG: NAD(P)/FAD-dependent oxidoreductase [Candidimonas sp.]TAM20800.1 MAG: NAD(P)/FAD-dependent oxidoreductase [Candidimonas sp.]TAM80475.1 MAG: NAD(P)/FAD-dependent oxidoreductase [Candidimonas sp.]